MPPHKGTRFAELAQFWAEPRLTAAVNQAARRQGTTAAEYLRQRVRAALLTDGIPPPHLETPRPS